MDEACKLHDIEYSKFKDSENRRHADKDLAERAWRRLKFKDASLGKKAVTWAVTSTMKAKSKIKGSRRRKKNCGQGLYLKPYKETGQGRKIKKSYKKRRCFAVTTDICRSGRTRVINGRSVSRRKSYNRKI